MGLKGMRDGGRQAGRDCAELCVACPCGTLGLVWCRRGAQAGCMWCCVGGHPPGARQRHCAGEGWGRNASQARVPGSFDSGWCSGHVRSVVRVSHSASHMAWGHCSGTGLYSASHMAWGHCSGTGLYSARANPPPWCYSHTPPALVPPLLSAFPPPRLQTPLEPQQPPAAGPHTGAQGALQNLPALVCAQTRSQVCPGRSPSFRWATLTSV